MIGIGKEMLVLDKNHVGFHALCYQIIFTQFSYVPREDMPCV
jgi:hypothetical protein